MKLILTFPWIYSWVFPLFPDLQAFSDFSWKHKPVFEKRTIFAQSQPAWFCGKFYKKSWILIRNRSQSSTNASNKYMLHVVRQQIQKCEKRKRSHATTRPNETKLFYLVAHDALESFVFQCSSFISALSHKTTRLTACPPKNGTLKFLWKTNFLYFYTEDEQGMCNDYKCSLCSLFILLWVRIPYKPEFFSAFLFTTAKVASITAMMILAFNYVNTVI